MYAFKPLRPRFVLDAFKLTNGGLTPLNETERRKFTTREQANELLKILPSQLTNAVIVDRTQDEFVGNIQTNYREDSNADNLYCLDIQANVKFVSSFDPAQGTPVETAGSIRRNCGELIFEKRPEHTKLIIDSIGQLVWA